MMANMPIPHCHVATLRTASVKFPLIQVLIYMFSVGIRIGLISFALTMKGRAGI